MGLIRWLANAELPTVGFVDHASCWVSPQFRVRACETRASAETSREVKQPPASFFSDEWRLRTVSMYVFDLGVCFGSGVDRSSSELMSPLSGLLLDEQHFGQRISAKPTKNTTTPGEYSLGPLTLPRAMLSGVLDLLVEDSHFTSPQVE